MGKDWTVEMEMERVLGMGRPMALHLLLAPLPLHLCPRPWPNL